MYERPRINVKVEPRQLLRLRVAFHTLPLFYLRAFARKNYASMKINPAN